MKRPLFWIGCVFLSTTAAFCHLPPGMALAFGLLAVLFALPLSGALASRSRIAILLLCVLAAGGNFMLRQHLRTSYAAPMLSGPLTVELTLTALEHRGARTRCAGRATLDSPAGEQRTLDASASSFFPLDAAVGDTLRFRARSAGLDPRSGALRLYIDRLLPAPAHPTHPLVSRLARLRRALALRAAALAPDRPGASGVLAAVLTGERAFLPDAEVRALRTAGLSHLVVVSGLHLATLAGVLGTLLSRLSARLRALLLLLFCWSFAVLTGFGPSVVRAAVMLSMLQLGDLLGRPSDGLTSLAAAGLLLSLLDPLSAGTVSLLLSFLATLGMLVFSRPVSHALLGLLPERLHARPSARALCDALSVAISAQLGAAPALAFSFGTLPLLGLLANLPAVPLVGALLPLGWVSLLLGPIFSPLASLLAALCGAMANLLLHIAHAVAPLPFCQLALTEWYQFAGLAALWLLLAALAALRPARRTVVRALLLGCCPLLLAANLFALLSIPTAELVLSPTSGAAALVRRDSAVLLGAPKDARSAEEFSDALARLGVRRIEAILLADPIGAAQPIAALAARFGCGRLLAPDTNRVRGFCGSSGLTLCALPEDPVWLCGARLTLEAQTATFLFPDGTLLKTGAECAIISQYPRPLPSLGEGISRYRYTIPGG